MNAKWVAVAERLRADIAASELTEQLPSEAELMESFRVSRTTIRKALTQLASEGLIESSQGSRRQVRRQTRMAWPMHSWETRHQAEADAWAVSVRDQGREPSTEVTVVVEGATEQVARALALDGGQPVVVRRRTRRVDGEVHQLADSYFPYALVKDHPQFLAPGDQSAAGGLLASAGLPQASFHDVIEARMPTPDESRLLKLSPGTPLLVHHRIGYTSAKIPVRYMVTRMGANQVELSYELPA